MGGNGLGSMLMTGAALGAGSAVGHAVVGGLMGGGGHGHGAQSQGGYAEPMQQQQQQQMAAPEYAAQDQMNAQQQQAQQNPCMAYTQYFLACLKQNADNINMCQMKMDMLSQCEKDYGMNQGI